MKTSLLMRHAKSDWSGAVADHERPLNERGLKAAPRMGQWIRDMAAMPDLIITSDAVRAKTTADLVVEASGYKGSLHVTPALYQADVKRLLEVLCSVDSDRHSVMIVAHNPGMEEFIATLTGRREKFPTAAIAKIDWNVEHWVDIRMDAGELVEFWKPKELD